MSILPDRSHVSTSQQESKNPAPEAADDPVTRAARRWLR